MRIIGGTWRRRSLLAPAGYHIRPTADRARESLFNILDNARDYSDWPLQNATVLDIFAGTGAFGLEALSRGAGKAVFIDNNVRSIATVRRNIRALAATNRTTVLQRDATQPGSPITNASLVFVDPPYRLGLAEKAIAAFAETGWFSSGALVIVEAAITEAIIPPGAFTFIETRDCGNAKFWFMSYP